MEKVTAKKLDLKGCDGIRISEFVKEGGLTMKVGDKLKIEIPEKPLPEKLKGVAHIRQIFKSATIRELENKDLIFVGLSPINKDWVIVKTPTGEEYEVHREFLRKVE